MATEITSNTINTGTTSNTSTAASTSGIYENPNSVLDKDSFMELLLVQLQYQDPTEPMDSEKILTQTSQLATLESAENTKKTMEELVNKLNNNMDMSALSAIGKMASMGSYSISLEESGISQFEMYFEKPIESGTLSIEDSNGNIVKTVSLEDQIGKSGVLAFQWDGYSDDGDRLSAGNYGVKASYYSEEGTLEETMFGIYPVESVKYQDGIPMLKLGSSYVSMEDVAEFY